MPNLIVTLKPEDGWDKKTLYTKLLEKAQLEKIKVEKPSYVIVWDSQPLIKGKVSNLQLTWRYKRFKKS
jgi:hypothetical protein